LKEGIFRVPVGRIGGESYFSGPEMVFMRGGTLLFCSFLVEFGEKYLYLRQKDSL
jgi:hypothetical protein